MTQQRFPHTHHMHGANLCLCVVLLLHARHHGHFIRRTVQLLVNSITQSANHAAAAHCIAHGDLLTFKHGSFKFTLAEPSSFGFAENGP